MHARILAPCALVAILIGVGRPAFGQRNRHRHPGTPDAQPQAPAAAPTGAQVLLARQHYERARALFAAGNFNGALSEFNAAYEARPHPIVYLSIAECYERLEDFRHAVEYLERYLRELPDARDRQQVQARIDAHRLRPSKIRITSTPPGATIVVDGRETSQRTPAEIDLTPGTHRVGARKDGFRESTADVQLEFAERRDLTLGLEPAAVVPPIVANRPILPPTLPTPPTRPEPTLPAPSERPANGGGVSGWAWVTGALTVAACGGGAVLGVLALQQKAAFEATPTNALADGTERFALFADVAFGVGAAAGVSTILMILLRGGSAEATAPPVDSALHVLPAVGRSAAGLSIVGRF